MLRLFLIALVLLAPGCASPDQPAGTAEVHDLRMTRRGTAFPVVTGTLVNESGSPISSADVFLTIYDEDNVPFRDPRVVHVRRVAPGDSARFVERLDVQARRVTVKYIATN